MTRLKIALTRLHGTLPATSVLSPAEVDTLCGASAAIAAARQRAAQRLVRARAARSAALQRTAQIEIQAREEAQRMIPQAVAQATDQALREAIDWLIDEAELEKAIARRVEARCRDLLANGLREYASELDNAQLLAERIARHAAELAAHGTLTLRLHPARLEPVRERLGADATFELTADASLNLDQAVIDSPFARLSIDLSQHLEQIVARLRGTPPLASAKQAGDPHDG
jgi:hypothetical protein